MPPYCLQARVAFHETDAAGIVHFSNFFRYAEEAETHALSTCGIGAGGYLWPRVHAEADYLRPLRFWEPYTVSAGLETIGNTSLHWRFEICGPAGLCSEIRYISSRRHSANNAPAPYTEQEKSLLSRLLLSP